MNTSTSKKKWIWRSTEESVEHGQISVLALLETAAAMFVYYSIAETIGTLHLAIAVALTPLLLLRTEQSISLGLTWWSKLETRIPKLVGWSQKLNSLEIEDLMSEKRLPFTLRVAIFPFKGLIYLASAGLITLLFTGLYDLAFDLNQLDGEHYLSIFGGLLAVTAGASLIILVLVCFTVVVSHFVIGLGALMIRFIATSVTVVRCPIASVSAIPLNWKQFVLSTDSFLPLEIIPGRKRSLQSNMLDIAYSINLIKGKVLEARSSKSKKWGFVATFWSIALLPYALFIFISSVALRWSLKGTAIGWGALIWIGEFSSRLNFLESWQKTKSTAYYQLAFAFSVVFLVFFFSKYFAAGFWLDTHEIWLDEGRDLLVVYAASDPTEIPRWHVASALNAFLFLSTYFVADYLLAIGNRVDFAERALQITSSIRMVLTIYTSFVIVYVLVSLLPQVQLPLIGDKWIPN